MAGCGGNNYCPANNITRGQMALYLLKGKEGLAYNPPPCTTPIFSDVPCSDGLAPWINELYRRGVTSGCSTTPLNYCPNNLITNAEMAVFVIQLTFQGTGFTVPPCSSAPFADVPCTYWAANWIAEEARRQVTTGCGGGNFCPASYVTRATMAGLIVHAFDIPYKIDPATPRNVQFAYVQGLLTGVTGAVPYGTLTYYPNLLVNQVAHVNGVTETQGNDLNEMRRPLSVGASGTYTSWSSGNYGYDGAGNIKNIGGATFTYDPVSRLVTSTIYDGTNGGGNQKLQNYTFDAFGNLTAISGTSGRNTPTSPQTNRLNGAGTIYDAAGNLTNWNSAVYQYDDFNQMIRMTSGAEDWGYVYTADDERIWMYNIAANTSRWTLRDLSGKVLREYLNNGTWSVGTDYIYRDGLLLAAETQTGQRHFHLDHLGTPRLITRAGGEKVAYHVYYPFGEEATAFNLDSERMKFTGHERDLASSAGAGDDLDYMHARHESPVTGRFLSVDTGKSSKAGAPQSWNKYNYVGGNPIKFFDPNGRELRIGAGAQAQVLNATRLMLPPALRNAVNLSRNTHGQSIISVNNSVRSNDRLFRNLQQVVNSKGAVEVNFIPANSNVRLVTPNAGIVTGTASEINNHGFTLPSPGTATGNEPALSPNRGITQVFVINSLPPEQQAATLAAELGAHALPALLGEGAAPESMEEHHRREDELAQEARTNAQQAQGAPPQ